MFDLKAIKCAPGWRTLLARLFGKQMTYVADDFVWIGYKFRDVLYVTNFIYTGKRKVAE